MSGSPLETAQRALELLRSLGIRHAVVGSVASSLQGVPRATVDVDLLVHLQAHQVGLLVNACKGEFYVSDSAALEAVSRTSMFNLVHLASGYKVDIHLAGDEPYEQTTLARARQFPLSDGGFLLLATPEDLILSKLMYRLGGEQSERQWNDVLGVLSLNTDLDHAYLSRWAEQLEILDLLDRVIAC